MTYDSGLTTSTTQHMNLEKYLVVAGMPGVHKVTATRNNGFVIEDLNEGRSRFVPMRQQQVTPLATIGTSSTAFASHPCAVISASRTISACRSANGDARVPRRTGRVGRAVAGCDISSAPRGACPIWEEGGMRLQSRRIADQRCTTQIWQ